MMNAILPGVLEKDRRVAPLRVSSIEMTKSRWGHLPLCHPPGARTPSSATRARWQRHVSPLSYSPFLPVVTPTFSGPGE